MSNYDHLTESILIVCLIRIITVKVFVAKIWKEIHLVAEYFIDVFLCDHSSVVMSTSSHDIYRTDYTAIYTQ